MKSCSICNCDLTFREATPFRLSGVSGYLCRQHNRSLADAITSWMTRAIVDVQNARVAAEMEERGRLEREAASAMAREISADRMALLAAEGLPLATRREMRLRGAA